MHVLVFIHIYLCIYICINKYVLEANLQLIILFINRKTSYIIACIGIAIFDLYFQTYVCMYVSFFKLSNKYIQIILIKI